MRPIIPRICFATTEYPPHVGGAARSAQRLVNGLAQTGSEVVVFTALSDGKLLSDIEFSTEIVRTYRLPFNLEAAITAIRTEDQRRPFDLFHGFTLHAAYPCLKLASQGKRPVVASIRGIDGMRFDDVAVEVLRRSSWITSVSSDSLKRAMTVRDISDSSSVIPNGVDMARFPPWRPSQMNAGVVGTVATFRHKKNIPLLIRSYSRIPTGIRRQLLLVGDSYDGNILSLDGRISLRTIIDEFNISAEVEITGFVDNELLPEFHQRMRVFVLSSDHEGMPNALLEAAASGVPIVATAVDGIKDIFTDGKDALLVEPGNLNQFSEAIEQVLTNEDLACRLSTAARDTAARLTPEAELQSYLELYLNLFARK